MTQQFFVPGPLPGMNDYISTGNRFRYNTDKKQWTRLIAARIREAKLKPMHRASIAWIWHEKTRRRDPDNFAGIGKKFILDALVACQILPDDGWDEIAGWSDAWIVDKKTPGVTVILYGEKKFNNGEHREV